MKKTLKSNGTRERAKVDNIATSTKIHVDLDANELASYQKLNAEAAVLPTSKPWKNFVNEFENGNLDLQSLESMFNESNLSALVCGEIKSAPTVSKKTK